MRAEVFGVGVVLVSFLLGWSLKSNDEQLVEVVPRKSDRHPGQARSQQSAHINSERWLLRFAKGDVAEVAQDLTDDELVSALEALLDDMWGGMGSEQAVRFQTVVGEWLQRNQDGCIAWARGQEDDKRREAALLAVVDQLGKLDLGAADSLQALRLYCEIERVTIRALADFDAEHWDAALTKVAKENPTEFANLLNRLPYQSTIEENGWGGGMYMNLRLPEDFDYEELFRLAPELERIDTHGRHLSVNLLQGWARQEPQAALEHVTARLAQGEIMRWGGLLREFAQEWGQQETMELALQVTEQIPREHLKEVLEASRSWKEILDAAPTEEQRLDYLLLLDPNEHSTDAWGEGRWREYARHLGLTEEQAEELGRQLRARASARSAE
ncbi:MAG: hypothetical protein Q7Q71_01760 [Verrucomicrobiota bacterium JB023]|nr:hypothetical protein [Verrucomicrobiota bacterium JB023]